MADGCRAYVQGMTKSVLVAMATTSAEGGTAKASQTAHARYVVLICATAAHELF